jgi:hypothetical protein
VEGTVHDVIAERSQLPSHNKCLVEANVEGHLNVGFVFIIGIVEDALGFCGAHIEDKVAYSRTLQNCRK